MNALKLITFDVTETLLKFRISPGIMYAKIGAEFGVSANPENIMENFNRHYKYMNNNHPNFGLNTIGWEKWWKEVVTGSFEGSQEGKIGYSVLNKIATRLIEIYKTPEGWETVERAHDMLSYLNFCNLPLGIISNFDERLETVLRAMDLHKYFKFIITSYNSGFEKPDSQIFNLALSQLGIKPCDALHVGNAPNADYLGAINAGWNAVLVHQDSKRVLREYPLIKSEHVFESLEDFYLYLRKNDICM